ncbi:conserved hypothetical protein [Neorickettsia risticii str. Illinois]|uniref:Uncharacterized protein n=1 Tax=Neorickettsia risticii (strain Illinois) TaxID=434131 RepID=C6V3R0_NEORI|nr:conserved hypothetical protein [Neorickettsia risticii str. Illinois]
MDIYESKASSLRYLGTNISGFDKILRRSSVTHNQYTGVSSVYDDDTYKF